MKRFPIAIAVFLFLAFGRSVFAAEFLIVAPENIAVGNSFEVTVMFDAKGEPVNTVAGNLDIAGSGIVKAVKLVDGGSVLGHWIERPNVPDGPLRFSGIIPGGFSGGPARLFAIEFLAVAEGTINFDFSEIEVLANDGNGGKVVAHSNGAGIIVSRVAAAESLPITSLIDNIPPERLSLEVASAPDMFGGKYFAVFDAYDAGSGIAGFDIMEEKRFGIWPFEKNSGWRVCGNPCVLEDQSRESIIYAKATDREGNYKIIHADPERRPIWYSNLFIIGAVCLAALVAAYFIVVANKKNAKKTN